MKHTIDQTYTFAHPIEAVWAALTTQEALSAWFMDTDLRPEVGHAFTFRTDPAPGFDGVIRCEVLEVEAPRLLRFTWKGGPVDTVVAWSLEPTATGTRLRVLHQGFEGLRGYLVGRMLGSGGRSLYGKRLAEHLAAQAGTPTDACMDRETRFFARLASPFARKPDVPTERSSP